MAETRSIQYIVEIDTEKGKAQLRELVEGPGGGSGAQGGPGGDGKEKFDPGKEADKAEDIWSVLVTRMKGGAGSMIQAGQGGQGFMGGVGGMMSAIPGIAGKILGAVTQVTDQLVGLTFSLSDFDGGLFEAKTKWDMFWMGFKIELAEGLSDSLSNLLDAVMDLAEAGLPALIEGLKLMANVLSPVIRGLARLTDYALETGQTWYEGAVASSSKILQTIGDWAGLLPDAEDLGLTPEEFERQMQRNNEIMKDSFHHQLEQNGLLSAVNDALGELDDRLKSVNREYSLMEKGFQVSRATLTMLEGFAYGADRQGAQGSVGLRADSGIATGAGSGDGSDVSGMGTSEASPAMTHSAASGLNATPSSFPRPTAASVNFKVTDSVNIQAGDEMQMLNELIQWKNDVLMMIHGLMDSRWMRLASARIVTERGMIGGGVS